MREMGAVKGVEFVNHARARSLVAAVGGVGLACILLAHPAAAADDEELAAIRAENRALAAQLERLEGELTALKQAVASNTGAVAGAGVPAVPQNVVQSGNDAVALTLYGQVSRVLMGADNGDEARWFHADNDYAETHIGIEGSTALDDDWDAGARIEVQFESNSSADVTINQNNATIASNSFTERVLELWFANEKAGTFVLGQGETPTDGITGTDLSGTGTVQGLGVDSLGSALTFANADGTSSGIAIGDVVNDFAGLGRDDRIGYWSPEMGGFTVGVSHVDGDARDIALFYAGEFDGIEVEGGAGFAESSAKDGEDVYGGSVSVRIPAGTSLTASWGGASRDAANATDPEMVFFKVAQDVDWIDQGATSLGLDWYEGSDIGQAGDEANSYSAAIVQHFDETGAEVYATWRRFSLDRTAASLQDIDVVAAGATIGF